MSDIDIAWQAAQDAAQALAPEVELVADLDMAGFGGSLVAVLNRALEHPATLTEASLRLTANLARTTQFAAAKAMGASSPPPIEPERDKRFADVTWEDNPAFAALRQFYLASQAVHQRGPRRWPGRPGQRRESPAGRRVPARRVQPDQLPADQPGRAEAGVRDRRREPGGRRPELPR